MACCNKCASYESSDENSNTDLDSSPEKSEKLSLGSSIEPGMACCDVYPDYESDDESSDDNSDTKLDFLTRYRTDFDSEKWNDLYLRQVAESDGFDVDDFRDRLTIFCGMVVPASYYGSSSIARPIKILVDLGIKIYNKKHATDYNSVEVEKVNLRGGAVTVLYITFKAKDGDIVNTFQALGRIRIPRKNGARHVSVTFCRHKGHRQQEDWNGGICCCAKA